LSSRDASTATVRGDSVGAANDSSPTGAGGTDDEGDTVEDGIVETGNPKRGSTGDKTTEDGKVEGSSDDGTAIELEAGRGKIPVDAGTGADANGEAPGCTATIRPDAAVKPGGR